MNLLDDLVWHQEYIGWLVKSSNMNTSSLLLHMTNRAMNQALYQIVLNIKRRAFRVLPQKTVEIIMHHIITTFILIALAIKTKSQPKEKLINQERSEKSDGNGEVIG